MYVSIGAQLIPLTACNSQRLRAGLSVKTTRLFGYAGRASGNFVRLDTPMIVHATFAMDPAPFGLYPNVNTFRDY